MTFCWLIEKANSLKRLSKACLILGETIRSAEIANSALQIYKKTYTTTMIHREVRFDYITLRKQPSKGNILDMRFVAHFTGKSSNFCFSILFKPQPQTNICETLDGTSPSTLPPWIKVLNNENAFLLGLPPGGPRGLPKVFYCQLCYGGRGRM